MPINPKKLPPAPPPEEGPIQKGFRWFGTPIADLIPGGREKLEKFATPKLSDVPDKPNIVDSVAHKILPDVPAFLGGGNVADYLPTTKAKMKGLVSGAAGAVTPALATQAASLGTTGIVPTIANAALSAEGVHDAFDSSKTTAQRVMGGVNAIGGAAGATYHGIKAKGASTPPDPLKTTAGLRVAAQDLRNIPHGDVEQPYITPPDVLAKHKALGEEIGYKRDPKTGAVILGKKPGGEVAQDILGPKGQLPPPSLKEVEASHQSALDLLGREAASGDRVERAKGAPSKITQKELKDKAPILDLVDAAQHRALTPQEHAIIQDEMRKYPKGVVAQVVGPNGIKSNTPVAAAKAQTAADKLTQNEAASDLQAKETVEADKAKQLSDKLKQAKIDEVKNAEGVIQSQPTVTETSSVDNPSGRQTVRQTFRPPIPETPVVDAPVVEPPTDPTPPPAAIPPDGPVEPNSTLPPAPKTPEPPKGNLFTRVFKDRRVARKAAEAAGVVDDVDLVRTPDGQVKFVQKAQPAAPPPEPPPSGNVPGVEISDYSGGSPLHTIEATVPSDAMVTPEAPVTPEPKVTEPPVVEPTKPKGSGKAARIAESNEGSNSLDALLEGIHGPSDQTPRVNPDSYGTLPSDPVPTTTIPDEPPIIQTGNPPNLEKAPKTPEEIMESTGVTGGAKPFEAGQVVAEPQPDVILSRPHGDKGWDRTSGFKSGVLKVGSTIKKAAQKVGGAVKEAIVPDKFTPTPFDPTTADVPGPHDAALAEKFPGEGPDSTELTSMPDDARNKLLEEMVKRVKFGAKNEGGQIDPALLMRMGTGAVGGALGYKEDPFNNKGLSMTVGAGLGAAAPSLPGLLGRSGEPVRNALGELIKLHGASLLSPLSVAKKGFADVGGLTSAAIENPSKAGDILRQFTTPEGRAGFGEAFREGSRAADQESLSGLQHAYQRGPLSWASRAMSGLTKGTKHALGESGFTVPEQQHYTLTADPKYDVSKNMYNLMRTGPMEYLSPFARIGMNRMERGWERSPFGLLDKLTTEHANDPHIGQRAALGTAAAIGAYEATPDDFVKNHPIISSLLVAGGGPFGVPIAGGMAGKTLRKNAKPEDGWLDKLKGTTNVLGTLAKDIPGVRLIEDLQGATPEDIMRNHLAGYTNFLRPVATALDPEEPDVKSNMLDTKGKIFNKMLANIPIERGTLPRQGGGPFRPKE